MAKEPAKRDKFQDILDEAATSISVARSRLDVFTQGNKASRALMAQGAEDQQYASLNRLVSTRLEELDILHGPQGPKPKIERGVYLAPTPRIGEPVVWLQGGDSTRPFAATVVAVERPGRVRLRILKEQFGDMHMPGVCHITDPMHSQKANTQTAKNGAWDYLAETQIPESHYRAAREELEKREDAARLSAQQEHQRRQQFEAMKLEAEKEEPLPV